MTITLTLGGLPSPTWVWQHRHDIDGILTLQARSEPGFTLPTAVKNSGLMSWHHPYTIKKWSQVSPVSAQRFRRELDEIAAQLLNGKRIHVHCAAGIHRTGTNAWALLVRCGETEVQAKDHVIALRPQAADFVRFIGWARANLLW